MAYEAHGRAVYTVTAAEREHSLVIRLFGLLDTRYETRIDLPFSGRPRCRFEIAERCLVAVDPPVYREPTNKDNLEGVVSVSAHVTQAGLLANLRVVEAPPSATMQPLTAATLANLKTWRVEPAPREDDVMVRYRYVTARRASPIDDTWQSAFPDDIDVEISTATSLTVTRYVQP
jgi:TonB family protein